MKSLLALALLLLSTALLLQAQAVTPTRANLQEAKPAAGAADSVDREAAARQARFFSFCLDGWTSFRGTCYLLANHPDSWSNAESFCSSFGANLASVHSLWEYDFLQRLLKTGGHSFGWIGGYYFQGAWRWEDGSQMGYANWGKASDPDLFQCAQMNSQAGRGWSSQDCGWRLPFLCQANPNC